MFLSRLMARLPTSQPLISRTSANRTIARLPSRPGDAGRDLRVFLTGDKSHCHRLYGLFSRTLLRMCNCGGQSFVNFDVIQIAERSLQVFEDFAEAFALDRLLSAVK